MDTESNTANPDPERFQERACPSCGGNHAGAVLSLRPGDFCPANETYRPEYLDLLRIGGDDVFPICECRSCGFQYARFAPDSDFLDRLYEQVIDDQVSHANQRRWSKLGTCCRVASVLSSYLDRRERPPDARVKVLDVGCGWGVQMEALPPTRFDVVGLETSAVRRDRLEEAGLRTIADLGTARDGGPYDFVICDNVLEHVPEPRVFLANLYGLADEGGAIYVVVPPYGPTRLRDEAKLLRRTGCVSRTTNPWEHLNYFSGSSLRTMLSEAGFEPIRMSQREDLNLNPTLEGLSRARNIAGALARMVTYVFRGSSEPDRTAVLAAKPESAS